MRRASVSNRDGSPAISVCGSSSAKRSFRISRSRGVELQQGALQRQPVLHQLIAGLLGPPRSTRSGSPTSFLGIRVGGASRESGRRLWARFQHLEDRGIGFDPQLLGELGPPTVGGRRSPSASLLGGLARPGPSGHGRSAGRAPSRSCRGSGASTPPGRSAWRSPRTGCRGKDRSGRRRSAGRGSPTCNRSS